MQLDSSIHDEILIFKHTITIILLLCLLQEPGQRLKTNEKKINLTQPTGYSFAKNI